MRRFTPLSFLTRREILELLGLTILTVRPLQAGFRSGQSSRS
jgi:hypothetical protein